MRFAHLAAVAALCLASTLTLPAAQAAPLDIRSDAQRASVIAGAAVGTAVGVGLYNGWYGTYTTSLLGATALGSAVVGGVAGVGTVAMLDAATQPCNGFNALFGLNKDRCRNGQYIGRN